MYSQFDKMLLTFINVSYTRDAELLTLAFTTFHLVFIIIGLMFF